MAIQTSQVNAQCPAKPLGVLPLNRKRSQPVIAWQNQSSAILDRSLNRPGPGQGARLQRDIVCKRPVDDRLSRHGILQISAGTRHSSNGTDTSSDLERPRIHHRAVIDQRSHAIDRNLKRSGVHHTALVRKSTRVDERVARIREGSGVDGRGGRTDPCARARLAIGARRPDSDRPRVGHATTKAGERAIDLRRTSALLNIMPSNWRW